MNFDQTREIRACRKILLRLHDSWHQKQQLEWHGNRDGTMATTTVKWQNDPLRKILKEDCISGFIPPDMKPAEAQSKRPEYKNMGKLFASRLRGMRTSITNTASDQKDKGTRWVEKNPVRQQMRQDIVTGCIPDSMDVATAWKLRDEYEEMDVATFKSRLEGMRKIVGEAKAKASADAHDLAQDRVLRPRPEFNARGEVQWVVSEAKTLLEMDFEDGKFDEMTPKELWQSRPTVYPRDCPILKVFRGHMHQIIKTAKWRKQWVDGKKEYALVPPPSYGDDN